jgi:hypothetical protein
MADKHSVTVTLAKLDATRRGWRLFPNPVGMGWVGRAVDEHQDSGKGRIVTLMGARRLRYGLTEGSFDLVGWRPVVVTPDMVGKTLAQFATVDAKTAGYSRLSPEQKVWARAVAAAGGFVAVAMQQADGSVAFGEIGEE